MTTTADLHTPALVVEEGPFQFNLQVMSDARPGNTLRPHVKAFKSTAVARVLAAAGHTAFCCATIREMEGMAAAGLDEDLLLANEVLDASRLGVLAEGGSRITLAVDSEQTIEAATRGRVSEVLIDVCVGLPRCGCAPTEAGRFADLARSAGLSVRGVMGYEGHLMSVVDRSERATRVREAMGLLLAAHADVGGDVVSAGGTGTFDLNEAATEIQAGSYLFMDTDYDKIGLPFRVALSVLGTVISVQPDKQWAVVDVGLKALGMDHGNPSTDSGTVLFCSDEHTTLVDGEWAVGDRVRIRPAHVDPTIARHETMWVVDGDAVVGQWPVDLRYW